MASSMLRILIRAGAIVQAGAIIVFLTGTAYAQIPISIPLQGESKRPLSQEEIDKQKAADKEYKAAIGKIPEKKTVDPWGNVRANPAPAPKTKQ